MCVCVCVCVCVHTHIHIHTDAHMGCDVDRKPKAMDWGVNGSKDSDRRKAFQEAHHKRWETEQTGS